MKGFGIYIKNDLLEAKHIENMGISVWLYMWLIDKMTSISEEGIGKVLGGKPIKYEEYIKPELGISVATYRRWIAQLEENNYIQTTRTPRGLVILVNKAVKIFNQKSVKSDTSEKEKDSDVSKVIHQGYKSDTSIGSIKSDTSNIRQDNIDNTKDNLATSVAETSKRFNALLNLFKDVNPSYEKLFENKTERKALEELVGKYGWEKIENLVANLAEITQKPYAPRITTPFVLQKKLGELIIFMKQQKEKGGGTLDARHIT